MRLCRDKDSCIYNKSNSCELIHDNITEERQAEVDPLKKTKNRKKKL